jgi:hypothetical protein
MIGQVIDFKDDFVTLTSISPSKEFRVPSARLFYLKSLKYESSILLKPV